MLIKKIEDILKQAQIEEYKQEAKMLVVELSNKTLEEIYQGAQINNEDEIIKAATLRAQDRIPIQHLIGYSYFMGDKYIVNKDVLIPRDETEFLVNQGYELLKDKKDKIDILEIGVGSGCLSCALAKKLKDHNIEILAVDISTDAIKVALDNINNLNLIRKIILRKSDLFSHIRDCEKFDLIISNPPYIPISHKDSLQYEVRHFDPELALFANDIEGVEFYDKIIKKAPFYLKKGGFVAFEAGAGQVDLIKQMLNTNFHNIEIIKDLAGIERVVSAQLR